MRAHKPRGIPFPDRTSDKNAALKQSARCARVGEGGSTMSAPLLYNAFETSADPFLTMFGGLTSKTAMHPQLILWIIFNWLSITQTTPARTLLPERKYFAQEIYL